MYQSGQAYVKYEERKKRAEEASKKAWEMLRNFCYENKTDPKTVLVMLADTHIGDYNKE